MEALSVRSFLMQEIEAYLWEKACCEEMKRAKFWRDLALGLLIILGLIALHHFDPQLFANIADTETSW